MPIANDAIMLGRSILLFRHLKHHNLFTGYDFMHNSRLSVLVPFLATKEALALLKFVSK